MVPKVQEGWGTLAKSPDVIPSIDVADRLRLCQGEGWQDIAGRSSGCCGNPHIPLSVIHFVITHPAQDNVLAVLQLLSRWLSNSSPVNQGLGHPAWKILVPRPTQRVLVGA